MSIFLAVGFLFFAYFLAEELFARPKLPVVFNIKLWVEFCNQLRNFTRFIFNKLIHWALKDEVLLSLSLNNRNITNLRILFLRIFFKVINDELVSDWHKIFMLDFFLAVEALYVIFKRNWTHCISCINEFDFLWTDVIRINNKGSILDFVFQSFYNIWIYFLSRKPHAAAVQEIYVVVFIHLEIHYHALYHDFLECYMSDSVDNILTKLAHFLRYHFTS